MITRDLFTENFNGEYDDEAGMARTNLVTIARAAEGLLNTIDDQENLPEWVQEKIAKVQGMMVTAWDYLESQEAQGIDPRQGVAEGNTEVRDKTGKVVSWRNDTEWHRAEKNKQGKPKDPRGVVTHLSDVARRKTASQQGMTEGAPRVDSLVTNGLKIMRGPTMNDAIAAIKYQVGERDFNERRGFYNFYVRQLMDMYGKQGVAEGKSDYNFDIEDLKRLERIRDLPTLKAQALALIAKPSAKPMKPEKVEWFKSALENMNSPIKVIKLMYDLMLSGEGHAVVGSTASMNPNSYRQKFGEQGVAEGLDKKEATRRIQKMLNTKFGANLDVDGVLGPLTLKSINKFMPGAKIGLADEPNKTTAVQGKQVKQQDVAEGEKIGNMDAGAYDSAMARLKQLAGSGPMKTVYDPNTRRYKNVPTAVQPAQQSKKK